MLSGRGLVLALFNSVLTQIIVSKSSYLIYKSVSTQQYPSQNVRLNTYFLLVKVIHHVFVTTLVTDIIERLPSDNSVVTVQDQLLFPLKERCQYPNVTKTGCFFKFLMTVNFRDIRNSMRKVLKKSITTIMKLSLGRFLKKLIFIYFI